MCEMWANPGICGAYVGNFEEVGPKASFVEPFSKGFVRFIGQFLLKPVGFRAKSEVYGPNLEEIGRLEWAFTYVKTQAILCVFSFAHQPCAHEFFIFFC